MEEQVPAPYYRELLTSRVGDPDVSGLAFSVAGGVRACSHRRGTY